MAMMMRINDQIEKDVLSFVKLGMMLQITDTTTVKLKLLGYIIEWGNDEMMMMLCADIVHSQESLAV